MSYYTTLYLDKEDYDKSRYKSMKDLETEINEKDSILADLWSWIEGLCAASPKNICPKGQEPFEYVTTKFNDLWLRYISEYASVYRLYRLREAWEYEEFHNKHYPEEEYKPHISYNHFPYNSSPEEGLDDTEKSINYCKNKILQYVCATPSDIFTKEQTEESSSLVDTIHIELNSLKEYLDDSLYDRGFCIYCIKYWDTHEEG